MNIWKAPQSMHYRLVICAVLVASWLGVAPLYAEVAEPPKPAVIVGNSQDNYDGDRVTFPSTMTVTIVNGKTKEPGHCLKAGTELRGIGQSSGPTKVDFVVIKCSPWLGFWPNSRPKTQCNVLCDVDDSDGQEKPLNNLRTGSKVQIDLADIQATAPNRYGLAFGALVVPFKFQLTGAHDFTGSATLGPYLGYRFAHESYGWALTLAGVAGVSNIAVTKSGSTQQLAGFTYGGAGIVEVKGGFQAGVVLGFDSVGSNQGFRYNNKPWLALELGYQFLK